MKNKIKIFLVIFLVSKIAIAEIREAPNMASALEGADNTTLVILDLDNTTMMPPQTLGGEEWFDYFVEKRMSEYKKLGMSEAQAKEKAIDKGLVEWNQFHKNARVIPVESETPKLISEIQAKGALTMALTARPFELGESTVSQLKSIGIELQKSTVSTKMIKVPGKNKATFYKGALLVGPKNNKGEVLAQFLKLISFKPKKIIFVDNKKHHVENVEKALADSKISYFGRRYGASDKKISSMNKDVLEIQHKYFFGEVLSDQEAKKLLDK